ncbi:hypothetical protein [Flavobacterium magnesitis]|uniref:hypothetical protein n=1 Tax=Flavobacterium magnesitis TaxID=3138077 RepID=UPI00358F914F
MNITLKKKKLQNGKFSLYLECYKDSTLNLEVKRIHLRDFEYLKFYCIFGWFLKMNPIITVKQMQMRKCCKILWSFILNQPLISNN